MKLNQALVFSTAFLVLNIASHAQKVTPVVSGAYYTLTTGATTITVGAAAAGRIRSLKYNGTEIFYTGGSLNWGSTFWPSPKSYWTATCKTNNTTTCFPPPTALDADATTYTGGPVTADTTISYVGATDAGTHLRFRKTYWVDNKDSSINNRYYMVNTNTAVIAFAPWEITRFPSGGLTFYPTGSDALKGTAGLMTMSKDTLGVRWFKYDSATVPTGSPAIYSDGGPGGWLAHVDKNRVILIKKFRDTPVAKQVPTITLQGEINWYTDPNKAYQEVEPQGSFDTIAVGDSSTWDVKWLVRKLPDSIVIGRNQSLLNFVTQQAGGPTALRSVATPFADFLERNGSVAMTFKNSASVSVSVVDVGGREIERLYSGQLSAGSHDFSVKTKSSSNGIHWLVVRNLANGDVVVRHMLMPFAN